MALRSTPAKKTPEKAAETTPAGLVICLDAHSGPHGTYARDARLRADHPAVTNAPHLWVADGSNDEEIAIARNDYFNKAVFDTPGARAANEAQAREQAVPMARATRNFSVPMADLQTLDRNLPGWGIFSV
jgi:hypothetical protein